MQGCVLGIVAQTTVELCIYFGRAGFRFCTYNFLCLFHPFCERINRAPARGSGRHVNHIGRDCKHYCCDIVEFSMQKCGVGYFNNREL